MGDRRRRSRAMQMAQYQASLDNADAEMINAEAKFANSLMQYEHHAEFSYRGSVTGHSFVQCDREECYDRMMKDYFIESSRHPAQDVQRRFQMKRKFFESILNSTDKYYQLAETTVIENLKRFCKAIEATYLRKPNCENLKRLLRKTDKRGFPGMIGSLDYIRWKWKNYPTAWAGQFKGHHNKPTIVLEVVASYDTWIWHAFFSALGSNNDINVLWSSPLFNDVVNGWAPDFRYKVNGNRYKLGYYLTDGVYPSWSTFVKSYSHPDSA
ncbi:uncharacterized protein LOC126602652 [Malus sylvestris]|uniref:uncharacterized protein LOC126602652 n=1 Tax=Malus sylvestris TaxID=3752 RepID=UPI0021AC3A82|nr:uncharacterized protein LOC126602652 [Malus sylvestris]